MQFIFFYETFISDAREHVLVRCMGDCVFSTFDKIAWFWIVFVCKIFLISNIFVKCWKIYNHLHGALEYAPVLPSMRWDLKESALGGKNLCSPYTIVFVAKYFKLTIFFVKSWKISNLLHGALEYVPVLLSMRLDLKESVLSGKKLCSPYTMWYIEAASKIKLFSCRTSWPMI